MDAFTTVTNAVFEELLGDMPKTPIKFLRPVLSNLTNIQTHAVERPSLNALFLETIKSKPIDANLTPRKRKKNSTKYGDENEAPMPKTPKNVVKTKFVESPMTPLSNLKLLTRVASMEDPIPSKKNLFESNETLMKTRKGFRRCRSETTNVAIEKNHLTNVKLKRYSTSSDLEINSVKLKASKSSVMTTETSRRDKSLGLLCERFIEHFPLEVSCLETPRRLVIDDVAAILGTERRRVYDIVNILECLNMASRVQKNMYQWMGKQHLEHTLSRLKGLAQQWGIGVHLNTPIEQSLKELKNDNQYNSDARKEKSLGVLCQKFLMLFLTSPPPHTIQLDTAIHLLLGKEGDDLEKLRTRGRRIYDIANVLISLQIIKKFSKSFMYIGPKVEASQLDIDLNPGGQQVRLRHSLLPPLFNSFVNDKSIQGFDDTGVTPSENDHLVNRKGRGRKLTSEYISKAKRNCLPTQSSEKSIKQDAVQKGFTRHLSLQDICQVAEFEREKLLKEQMKFKCNKTFTCSSSSVGNEKFKILKGNIDIQLPRFTSPRMALTFHDSNLNFRPSLFTNRPCTFNTVTPQSSVKPPIIFKKVELNCSSNSVPDAKYGNKPVYVVRTIPTASQIVGNNTINLNAGKGIFKVYSKHVEKVAASSDLITNYSIKSDQVSISSLNAKISSPCKKQITLNPLPYISLNTVARNHYKTVFGCEAQIPKKSLSSRNPGSYHFVINTKDSKVSSSCSTSLSAAKENSEPTFVKMFNPSPDNSSTDSELDNIFGDSFNFTRPKGMVPNFNGK